MKFFVLIALAFLVGCTSPLQVKEVQKSFYIKFENLMTNPDPYNIPLGIQFGEAKYVGVLPYGEKTQGYQQVTSGFHVLRFLGEDGEWSSPNDNWHNSGAVDGGAFTLRVFGSPNDPNYEIILDAHT